MINAPQLKTGSSRLRQASLRLEERTRDLVNVDYPGAVVAWEQLLQSSPSYPNAADVRQLLTDARLKSSVIRQ